MSDAVQRGPNRVGAPSNLFFQHCSGSQAPCLLCENPASAEVQRVPFTTPFLLIGRSSRCDLSLDHPDVSYRHAYLQLVGGRVLCIDLDSRTGIFWGTQKKRAGWLEQQEVAIGPYRFRLANEFQDAAGSAIADTGESREELPDAEYRLDFLNGLSDNIAHADYRFFRPVTLVGRSKFCNVWLRDESVSRVHCSFVLSRGGLWIVDLLGRGGTRLNGKRIQSACLQDGDRVRIGRFRFRIRKQDRSVKEPNRNGGVHPTEDAPASAPPALVETPSSLAPLVSGCQEQLISRNAPTNGAFSENFVLSVINEFAAMQQEMFAQTRQQMMMMAQLLDRMHENHRNLIRKDLLRVQEITHELHKLRIEFVQARTTDPSSLRDDSEIRPPAPQSNGSVNGHHAPEPSAGEDDDRQTADSPRPRVNGIPSLGDKGTTRNHRDVASHAWLAERMGILEQERAGRWQKIMQALTRGTQGTT